MHHCKHRRQITNALRDSHRDLLGWRFICVLGDTWRCSRHQSHSQLYGCSHTRGVGLMPYRRGSIHATNAWHYAAVQLRCSVFTFHPQELPAGMVLAIRKCTARGHTWNRQRRPGQGPLGHHPGHTPSNLPHILRGRANPAAHMGFWGARRGG